MNCKIYSTPQSKRDRLRDLGGCFKCGFLNHKSKECRYKFNSKCSICNNYHYTYLCVSSESDKTSEKSVKQRKAARDKSEVLPLFL